MKYSFYKQVARLCLATLLLFALSLPATAFDIAHYATGSKLSSGKWVKIKIEHDGIYQITQAQAKAWGFSGDVSSLHVFGRGGAQISEYLTDEIVDDLPAVPVLRDEENGKLLFYAQGPVMWESTNGINQAPVQNTYSTAAYYFVTDDERFSDPELPRSEKVDAAGQEPVTTFSERVYHENDINNPGETGRTFLGEDFRTNKSQDFNFTLKGLVEGSQIKVLTRFAAKTTAGNGATVSFKYNGESLPTTSADHISPVGDIAHDHYYLSNSLKTFTMGDTENLTYNISLSSTGTLRTAALDFIAINYERNLDMSDEKQLIFKIPYLGSTTSFRISNAADNTHVWNITDNINPVDMQATTIDGAAQFTTSFILPQTFIAFDADATFPVPELVGNVENQDIHALPVPDMIIITVKDYKEQALRVAKLHEDVDGMRVHVLIDEQVMNEFAAGTPDAMAYRMVCKYFYDRGEEDGHKLGYLLLMGNGSFDNRGISSEYKEIAYPKLFTWQTRYSNDENQSYTSDDPFGILGDKTGPTFHRETMSIAVGRFPVKSVGEARIMVNKLVNYVTKPDYGAWKTNILNVADDGDNAVHMKQAEEVITQAKNNGGGDFVFNRVYLDATLRESDGGANKYPEARKKMYSTLQDGVTWWNYTGHSGISTWTGDGLMLKGDIENELYYKHLPILYAATCEFTRFDAIATSGGEMMLLNTGGGAIAVICPPRLALVYSNGPLNSAVAKYIFARDEKGLPLRLGDILRLGKRDYPNDDNTLRYVLCGDPAMRPAFPAYRAVVDQINGVNVNNEEPPVVKARQAVTFTGHIEDLTGAEATNFNGSLISTLFDCETSVTSHGYGDEGAEFVFQERSNKLSINHTDVRNGQFTIQLIVPGEVLATYDNYQPALISLYAWNPTDSIEANGSTDHFYIYGYDETVEDDGSGPEIFYLRLNNDDFKNGDNVSESPLVLARVGDESGINFSSAGIGHAMTITLDDKTTFSDVVNYYTPVEMPVGNEGVIAYPLSNLSEGRHSLKLKVWDVFANSSEQTIEFNVVKGMKPDVIRVYSDANPAGVETNFYVQHNIMNANVTITLEVFDLLGRTVWSTTQSGRSNLDTSFPIHWDLTDATGTRVPRGIYVYRASVSTDGIHANSKAQKLAVTAQ